MAQISEQLRRGEPFRLYDPTGFRLLRGWLEALERPDPLGPELTAGLDTREAVTLRRVTHAMVDFGMPSFVTSDLKLVTAKGGVRALVEAVIVPRVEPIIEARVAITKGWPKKRGVFHDALGDPPPGTVTPREAIPKIDFDSERAELAPAARGTEVAEADGLEGRGVRVSGSGSSAAARLVFKKPVPEVETWIAFAVKLESRGMLSVWAKEATDAGDGGLFRWRTVSLAPGRWHRLAIPLGALEPAEPKGGDESLLMKRVYSIGFSMNSLSKEQAAFVLDDILVHHGLVPNKTDDPPEPPSEPAPEAAPETAPEVSEE